MENKEEKEATPEKQTPEKEEKPEEEDNRRGCTIGFRALETLRSMVKTPMERLSDMEDTIKCFKFTVPKALTNKVEKVTTTTICAEQK